MPTYKITYQKQNKICTAKVQAHNQQELFKKYTLLDIKVLEKRRWNLPSLHQKSLQRLIEEFDTLLGTGLPMNEVLPIIKQSKLTQYEQIALDLIEDAILHGKSIAHTLESHPSRVDTLIIQTIHSAEQTGDLQAAFHSLKNILHKKNQHKQKILKALTYPFFLLVSMVVVLCVIFYFIIPRFEILFSHNNSHIPLMTQMLFGTKEFIHNYGLFFLFTLLGFGISFYFFYQNSLDFKEKFDKFLFTKLPFIKTVLINGNLFLFFYTISQLLHKQYQFQVAFEKAKIVIYNSYLKKELRDIEKSIKNGKSISQSVGDKYFIENTVVRILYICEHSNTLKKGIEQITKRYERKLENNIQLIIAGIQPFFLVFISLFILWIVLAIFVPMWDIGNSLNY